MTELPQFFELRPTLLLMSSKILRFMLSLPTLSRGHACYAFAFKIREGNVHTENTESNYRRRRVNAILRVDCRHHGVTHRCARYPCRRGAGKFSMSIGTPWCSISADTAANSP